MENKRLFTKQHAADYCDISVPAFNTVCPVRPICLGDNRRLDRWDKKALDLWLDGVSGFSGPIPVSDADVLAMLGKGKHRN